MLPTSRVLKTFLIVFTLPLIIIQCTNISGDDATQIRQMRVTMTAGATDVSNNELAAARTNHIELRSVKMLLDNLELETVSDDSLDFEINDLVVDLPLDGDTLELTNQEVPAGSYDKLDIEIDSDAVEDSVLNDSTGNYSIVVQGLYLGDEFIFRTNREFEEEFRFSPPIEVTDSTTNLALNLSIDLDLWFENANPNDPRDQDRIERNIRRSLDAYCRYGDNNQWQRHDD